MKLIMKGRKLMYGCCINDVIEPQSMRVNGKQVVQEIFKTWKMMIVRAYSPKAKSSCLLSTTVEDWKVFSNFKSWMEKQNYGGLCLDKDILVPGNKVYGPDTCCFVPHKINTVLNIPIKREEMLGVYFRAKSKIPTYIATGSMDGKGRHIGCFRTPEEVHKAWQMGKALSIEKLLNWYAKENSFNSYVADALMSRVWKLRSDALMGIETKFL